MIDYISIDRFHLSFALFYSHILFKYNKTKKNIMRIKSPTKCDLQNLS
jgi:hypothetical protein